MRRLFVRAGLAALAAALCLGLLAGGAAAQGGYRLAWWTLDDGGGVAAGGGAYAMRGTAGQPDAARLAGGPYSLFGGFWAPATAAGLRHWVFLPVALTAPVAARPAALPDLVVEAIRSEGGALAVVIANRGEGAVTAPFWVDLYINPASAPTSVNQTWSSLGGRGLVWGVDAEGLPLSPGATLTLTLGDRFYSPVDSRPGGALRAGDTIYAQVDSVHLYEASGGVAERDELPGGAYNNIARATVQGAVTLPATDLAAAPGPQPALLPAR